MHTVDVLNSHCTALRSDILFLKKEIAFLLKILGNCYSSSIHTEQLKLQDRYWKDFEAQDHKLDLLSAHIQKEELRLADLYLEGLIRTDTVSAKEAILQAEFGGHSKDLRILKESFYVFMNGCSSCALKAAC